MGKKKSTDMFKECAEASARVAAGDREREAKRAAQVADPQPPMWAAVQELAEQVRQQAERIQSLESRLRSLESRLDPTSWQGP